MKKQIASYFSFSKKELNGILILFVLITLILSFPYGYRIFDKPSTYDLGKFSKEIALFKASAVERKRNHSSFKQKTEHRASNPDYFKFDPNTASGTELSRLGLSSKQIKIIYNYRLKKGKFYKNEDLRKIYSITEAQYLSLEPYINIQDSNRQSYRERQLPVFQGHIANNTKAPALIVEVNAADSAALDKLRGIGPAFASRIIRFRNRLGGFYNKNQLKEVYGMDSLRYSLIENQIIVDPGSIKRLNLNTLTFGDLKNHPYLSFKQINAIIQYRTQHGNYTSADGLKKVLILNDEIIRKIEPYLSFQQ